MATKATPEVYCSRRLHARLAGTELEIHCRYCTADRRRDDPTAPPVFHRWHISMFLVNGLPQLMATLMNETDQDCGETVLKLSS